MGTVPSRRTRRQDPDPSSESPETHPSAAPMRRIVCRFTSADIALLDEVRARFPKVRSRAALIRALCIMGLTNAEQAPKVTP